MSGPTYSDELLKRGIAAARAGRKEEARQALLEATRLDDQNEQVWLWLSSVVDSLEDRRACLENVLAINPENAHARQGLQWLDRQISPPPTAQEPCPRCGTPIAVSASVCPHCNLPLVVACPACGRYVEVSHVVCPECGQFLGNFRSGARYHLALARAYMERHRYSRAQEAIERAEAEAPDDLHVLEGAAALQEKMGHMELAIAIYQRAIERYPEAVAFYVRLGAIYRQRAMPDEARGMYERAAELAGDDPAVLFELAQLYIEESGMLAHARDLLEKAIQLDPAFAKGHALLGDVYLDLGEGKRALEAYRRAAKLAEGSSLLGRDVRHKLAQLQPSLPERQTQGWGETLRRMAALVISPLVAVLVNARLRPLEISLAGWGALLVTAFGAYLWVCASDVPRNPGMRAFFGDEGAKGVWRQALVGLPGAFVWAIGFGLILAKV